MSSRPSIRPEHKHLLLNAETNQAGLPGRPPRPVTDLKVGDEGSGPSGGERPALRMKIRRSIVENETQEGGGELSPRVERIGAIRSGGRAGRGAEKLVFPGRAADMIELRLDLISTSHPLETLKALRQATAKHHRHARHRAKGTLPGSEAERRDLRSRRFLMPTMWTWAFGRDQR